MNELKEQKRVRSRSKSNAGTSSRRKIIFRDDDNDIDVKQSSVNNNATVSKSPKSALPFQMSDGIEVSVDPQELEQFPQGGNSATKRMHSPDSQNNEQLMDSYSDEELSDGEMEVDCNASFERSAQKEIEQMGDRHLQDDLANNPALKSLFNQFWEERMKESQKR